MSDTPMNADDVAATLTAFAISLIAALKPKSSNEVLKALANELGDFAERAPGTPAADALSMTARMLVASEPDE